MSGDINKHGWHKEYKRLLIAIAGLTVQQAEAHFNNGAGKFDYGYSPMWYVREELYCHVFGVGVE